MARFSEPILFSDHFGLDPAELDRLDVLNPTLNVDTNLFIDPLLIEHSRHKEISQGAQATYQQHFATVIKLLLASKQIGDPAWKAAERLLRFPEVKGTCLGYGAESVSGSGSGTEATASYIATAREIVALGIDDPDLFVAMSLFEEGVGPDRISDMTTNVVMPDLIGFNARILVELKIETQLHTIRLKNGKAYTAHLPTNPCITRKPAPIILVPRDILRHLPMASDWDSVGDVAAQNAVHRQQINEQLGDIWKRKSLEAKGELKAWALQNGGNFQVLLDILHGAKPVWYDFTADPKGELTWRRLTPELIDSLRKVELAQAKLDIEAVNEIVRLIIDEFRFLIEDRRFSEELYAPDGSPRPERSAQRLFFAVAYAFCKAHDLDLTPEADTGNGPVDFKVASGFKGRVLVEIKLSTNNKVVSGYTKQLETYKTAEETQIGYYVMVDVGGMGKKDSKLIDVKNAAAIRGEKSSEIVFINGHRKPSASKL